MHVREALDVLRAFVRRVGVMGTVIESCVKKNIRHVGKALRYGSIYDRRGVTICLFLLLYVPRQTENSKLQILSRIVGQL